MTNALAAIAVAARSAERAWALPDALAHYERALEIKIIFFLFNLKFNFLN